MSQATAFFREQVKLSMDNFNYENALFLCERLLARDPSPHHKALLAEAYYRKGHPNRCYQVLKPMANEMDLEKATDEVSMNIRYLFARACVDLEKNAEAEKILLGNKVKSKEFEIKQLRPDQIPRGSAGFHLLAQVMAKTGRVPKAKLFHLEALKADRFLWTAYTALCDMGDTPPYDEIFQWTLQPANVPSSTATSNSTKNNTNCSNQAPVPSPSQASPGSKAQMQKAKQILLQPTPFSAASNKVAAERMRALGNTPQILNPLTPLSVQCGFAESASTPWCGSLPGSLPGAPPLTHHSHSAPTLGGGGTSLPKPHHRIGAISTSSSNPNPRGALLPSTAFPPLGPPATSPPGSPGNLKPMKPLERHGRSTTPVSATGSGFLGHHTAHDPSGGGGGGGGGLFGQKFTFSSAQVNGSPDTSARGGFQTSPTAHLAHPAPCSAPPPGGNPFNHRTNRPYGNSNHPNTLGQLPFAATRKRARQKISEAMEMDVDVVKTKRRAVIPEKTPQVEKTDKIKLNQHGMAEFQAMTQVILSLAKAYQLQSQYRCKEALEVYNDLPTNQRTGWVLSQVGRCWFEMVKYDKAIQVYDSMFRETPWRIEGLEFMSTALWHLKDEVKLSYVAQELKRNYMNEAITWIVVGNFFSLQKEHEQALGFFKKAKELEKNNPYAHTLAAHEFAVNEDYEQAMQGYRQAIQLDCRHYNAWWGLGSLFQNQESYDLAEYHYRQAIKIHPRNAVAYCFLGMTYCADGKLNNSLEVLNQAEKIDPENTLVKFQKAKVYEQLASYDEAIAELRKLAEICPKESSVHLKMGCIYTKLKQTKNATLAFSEALSLNPKEATHIKAAMDECRAKVAMDEEMA